MTDTSLFYDGERTNPTLSVEEYHADQYHHLRNRHCRRDPKQHNTNCGIIAAKYELAEVFIECQENPVFRHRFLQDATIRKTGEIVGNPNDIKSGLTERCYDIPGNVFIREELYHAGG